MSVFSIQLRNYFMNTTSVKKTSSPLVKICGITHNRDFDACDGMGIHSCGFNFDPKSTRCISPARASQMKSSTTKRIGIFTQHSAFDILKIMKQANLDYAQLNKEQSIDCAIRIGPHRVIRTIWADDYPDTESLLSAMEPYSSSCSMFLLHASRNPIENGRINWQTFNKRLALPWFLSGNFSLDTLPEILELCQPDGINLNTQVEWAPGQKSPDLLLKALSTLSSRSQRILNRSIPE